jgi:hypothetical protein
MHKQQAEGIPPFDTGCVCVILRKIDTANSYHRNLITPEEME